MITAQRDRFKTRNSQLETELSESHRTVSQLRQEIAAAAKGQPPTLRKDTICVLRTTVADLRRRRHQPTRPIQIIHCEHRWHWATWESSWTGIGRQYESNISPFAAF